MMGQARSKETDGPSTAQISVCDPLVDSVIWLSPRPWTIPLR